MELKGGFQSIDISKADLTASTLKVDGLSKACAGANDKPVRIKMPGGIEYYGSLKPTAGGFVISYLGADSKVCQFNVDDTDDTFTMQTGEDTSAGEPNYRLKSTVNIGSYTDENPFVAPADGYAQFSAGSTALVKATSLWFKTVNSEGTESNNSKETLPVGATNDTRYVFVKKGLKFWMASRSGGSSAPDENASLYFQELIV